jgi:hypothetical protein
MQSNVTFLHVILKWQMAVGAAYFPLVAGTGMK